MAWTVQYDPRAVDNLSHLDRQVRREIIECHENRIALASDPRQFGNALRHDLAGLWRYPVRDYRVICQLRNETLTVLVVDVGHRRDVYR